MEQTAVEFHSATPILRVADFDVSVDYYRNALGFELAWSDDRFGCVVRGDAALMLSEGSQGKPGCWVWIGVSDADALFMELTNRSARIRVPPRNYPWGSREVHVFDADGHVLRFGSDAREGEPLGEWLDEDGISWRLTASREWTRVEN